MTLPSHLTCPICTRLLHTPSRTPCCKSLYCEECIHNHLLDNDFVCPSCESKISSLKGVKMDEGVKKEVDEFVDVEVERRKQERKAAGDEGEGSEDEVKGEVKEEDEQGKVSQSPPVFQTFSRTADNYLDLTLNRLSRPNQRSPMSNPRQRPRRRTLPRSSLKTSPPKPPSRSNRISLSRTRWPGSTMPTTTATTTRTWIRR